MKSTALAPAEHDRSDTLVHFVPRYRFDVNRHFDEMNDVVDTIVNWHDGRASVGV